MLPNYKITFLPLLTQETRQDSKNTALGLKKRKKKKYKRAARKGIERQRRRNKRK
jgi:hypothetical protein